MPPEITETQTTQTGHPKHGDTAPNDSLKNPPEEVTATEEEITDPPAQETVLRLGSKTFSSAEEASQYVAQLESAKLDEITATRPTAPGAPAPTREMIDGKPIDEVLFENPTKVVQHITNKVLNEVGNQSAKKTKADQLWQKFYTRNPDLRGKDRLVQSVLQEKLKELDKLSEEDAMKALAKSTRDEIKAMGFEPGKVTDLPPANPATLGGSSRGSGGQAPVVQNNQPSSFTAEVLAIRAKRAAAAAKIR